MLNRRSLLKLISATPLYLLFPKKLFAEESVQTVLKEYVFNMNVNERRPSQITVEVVYHCEPKTRYYFNALVNVCVSDDKDFLASIIKDTFLSVQKDLEVWPGQPKLENDRIGFLHNDINYLTLNKNFVLDCITYG